MIEHSQASAGKDVAELCCWWPLQMQLFHADVSRNHRSMNHPTTPRLAVVQILVENKQLKKTYWILLACHGKLKLLEMRPELRRFLHLRASGPSFGRACAAVVRPSARTQWVEVFPANVHLASWPAKCQEENVWQELRTPSNLACYAHESSRYLWKSKVHKLTYTSIRMFLALCPQTCIFTTDFWMVLTLASLPTGSITTGNNDEPWWHNAKYPPCNSHIPPF